MIYKVIKNGDTVLLTHSFKHAADEYDKQIYNGKHGDIIKMYVKKDSPSNEWELARKDWM